MANTNEFELPDDLHREGVKATEQLKKALTPQLHEELALIPSQKRKGR